MNEFLKGEIAFPKITSICKQILDHHTFESEPTLERLYALDRWARQGGFRPRMTDILYIPKNLIEVLYWFIQPTNWPVIFSVAGGLGFVIFVHELGHFAAAKWCGVRCDKFYIGFDLPLGKLLDWLISRPIKLVNRKFEGIVFFQKFIPSSLFKYKKARPSTASGLSR